MENETLFLHYLNAVVRKCKDSNIGAVNAIQNNFVYLHQMGEQIIKKLLHQVYLYFSSHFLTIPLSISTWKKSYEDIYHSPPRVCVSAGNILLLIIISLPTTIFFLLPQHFHEWFYVFSYNSNLMKLEWTLLLLNFNYIRDLTNRCRFPAAEYAFLSDQIRTLKTHLLNLKSYFSIYYLKKGAISLLFFSSHIFIFPASEFDSDHLKHSKATWT